MLAALLLATVAAAGAAGGAAGGGRTAAAPNADAPHAAVPGALEGRPSAAEVSRLQGIIDAAAPGATVVVEGGIWRGDVVIDRPLALVGRGRPRLVGSGAGSVVRIRAAGVTLEGFDIDGRAGGNLARDTSGVHVAAAGAVVRDCRIENALFGVYLREADGAVVERCTVRGIPGRTPGEKGSGIHAWNTNGFRLADNLIEDVRDGLYVQSSSRGVITGNTARDLRYGLHYMYSDDNLFEGNTFEGGAAGTAIMYSKRIVFRRNRFVRNRGFASVGLLLKACDDVLAEGNLIADNARGIFLEGSNRNVLRGNIVAASDMAIVLYDSCAANRFEGNSFVANMTPLWLVGRRTDTLFDGNYWSGNDEADLDGDGVTDGPYRLTSVFDHVRGNLMAADLFTGGPAALALGAAEEAFPVLQPVGALDARPLARPPRLSDVPMARAGGGPGADWTGLLGSSLVGAAGAVILARAGRRRR
jgi:nitrous oxidase accessory protein